MLIQQHHYQAIPAKSNQNVYNYKNLNNNEAPENSNEFNSVDFDHASNCSSLSKSFNSNISNISEDGIDCNYFVALIFYLFY